MKANQTLTLLTLLLFKFFSYNSFAQDSTPPVVNNPIEDRIIPEDQHFELELNLNEVFSDESPLTFSVDLGHADWLANVGDSVLVGFPLEEHAGESVVKVTAVDASGNSSSTSFSINVTSEDDKPIVIKNLPGQLQRPGFGEIKIGYKDLFYDEEDESLSYDVRSSYPAVVTASIVGDSIVVTEKGVGPAEIILTATDSNGNQAETKMFIRVFKEDEILNMTTANTGSNKLANSKIDYIMEDATGDIWLGSSYGYELCRIRNSSFEQIKSDINIHRIVGVWNNGPETYVISFNSILLYNGHKFSRFNPVASSELLSYYRASCISPDNTLFVAGFSSNNDFNIFRNKGDGWEVIYERIFEGKRPEVQNMCSGHDNNIWLATDKGLMNFKNDSIINFTEERGLQVYIRDVDVDIYGDIWFLSPNRLYKYDMHNDSIISKEVQGGKCLFADDIGNIWVGKEDCTILKIKSGNSFKYTLTDPFPEDIKAKDNSINHIYKTSDGRYWFCSQYGLYISQNYLIKQESTILQNTYDGIPSNEIIKIIRDKNGIYWVFTSSGTVRFDGQKWEYLGENIRIQGVDQEGRALCESGNIYMFGNKSFSIFDGNDKEKTYDYTSTKIEEIDEIKSDHDNNIWICGSGGIAKFDGVSWVHYSTEDGLLSNDVEHIFPDSKGNLWVEYAHTTPEFYLGISKFDGNTFMHFGEADGLADKSVNDFLEDLNGNIWMATYYGLSSFDGENWTRHTGLKAQYVASLDIDFQGGVWITYDWNEGLGVSRFNGTRFDHFTTDDGLPTNNIKKVYVDHALTNQNKSGSQNKSNTKDLIWLGTGDKGAANFYLQTATSVVDQSLPEMKAIIFPNPTQGTTNIILDNQQRRYLDVEVLSLDGKMVYQNKTSSLTGKIQLNLSSYPPGTYLLKLKSDIDSVVKKIIIN